MANFTWKKGTIGDWADAANWVNNAVPAASDDVFIPQDATFQTQVRVSSPISVASIENGADLSFENSGASKVTGNVSCSGADLLVRQASLTIGGELSLTGDYDGLSIFGNGTTQGRVRAGSFSFGNFCDLNIDDGRLDVKALASFGIAGVLTGQIRMEDKALIDFSGTSQITKIARSGSLQLLGPQAFIADAGIDLDSNSALTGLRTLDGTLGIYASTLTTNGSLTVSESGEFSEIGTGSVSIGGTLVNRGQVGLNSGGGGSTVSLSADSVDNTGGELFVDGDTEPGTHISVDIAGSAAFGTAGAVKGLVMVSDAVIDFAGTAQLTTIYTGASLLLAGAGAFVADTGLGLDSNSALTGLATIEGALTLSDSAEIDTSRPLAVKSGGTVTLNGGTLTTAGILHNVGKISESGAAQLEVGDALVNAGTMSLGTKGVATQGLLDVSGSTYNNGTMVFRGGSEDFSGALVGKGAVGLGGDVTLRFDATVGSQQFLHFALNDTLDLSDAADFHGSVHNFTHGDAYLFDAYDTSTSFNFVENAAQTGGVLNVSDGANNAHIRMHGVYDNSDFALTAVQGGIKIASTR